ncbi:HTH-type transcriptional regulator MalT [Vibrio nitrifigilis]|uniref:HTH-type transcriptional regulator MalT n=1 Tax=Vibrio nitrifigilis TaxID=2789781 RepID=A0ABS0GLU3_9VIBR|nr:HTH-type transcriptional regulator MalT [Vibrio nitrifigilis]MBF9003437.1 HTH-type transcriptional regulator MalT [Vibrio nitrifigilis]
MWIPSKLVRPDRQNHRIIRPRILAMLKQAQQAKLVLFRTPAGYGKTTMVLEWLDNEPHVGWFNIDPSDNDSYRFTNYLIQALNQALDGQCENSQTLAQHHQYTSLHALFTILLGELTAISHHTYLVLDDYHHIHSEDIHDAMRFFLKHLPTTITLVLTSRSVPPLGTANLRVREQLVEIDHQQLAFDNDETARFMAKRTGKLLDDVTVKHLRQYVEGWPSALQLIAMQSHPESSDWDPNTTPPDHTHLWEYLIEEVFSQLDPDTQIFLMQCSIVEDFNAEMACIITGNDDALRRLEQLSRLGLFIWPVRTVSSAANRRLFSHYESGHWFRFHNLFAEFLTHQRQSRLPDQEAQLHSLAAQAWLNENNANLALHHASLGHNMALQVDILLTHGWPLFNQGALEALDIAIDSLDDEALYSHPSLCLMQAWLAQSQHRYEEVASLLDYADQQMALRKITPSTREQAEFNALKAQVAINQNQPNEALELAEQALSFLDNTTYQSRIVATSVVGEVNHVLGDLSRALSMMQQTEKLARQYQIYPQALWAMLQQSEILLAQGYAQAAYEVQDNAFQFIKEHHLQQLPLHEFLLRIRGQLLWCWNQLEESETNAFLGLEVLGEGMRSKHLHCYSLLAIIAISRGEIDKASRYISEIQQRINTSTFHVDWTAHASAALILYWQVSGDTDAVEQWLANTSKPEEARNHFTQLQWRNIVRANMIIGQEKLALQSLNFLIKEATTYQLVTDLNRAQVLQAYLYEHQNQHDKADKCMQRALKLSSQTGMVGNYLLGGELILPVIKRVANQAALSDAEKFRAANIIKAIESVQNSRSAHFDEEFIKKLTTSTHAPELIRTSPLTSREWQVLGLIYSGLSNEQIAQELDVAGTTIKTHIRNLYQKLNIANRKEAIATAEHWLNMLGY